MRIHAPCHEIRATHPYAYRTEQWARILMIVSTDKRLCWLVEFDDGDRDLWPIADAAHGYEFR